MSTVRTGVRSDPPTITIKKARSRTPEEQAKKDAQNRGKALRKYHKKGEK